MQPDPTVEPTTTPSESTERPGQRTAGWLRWTVPVAGLVLGVGIGAAAAQSDPTQSAEYLTLERDLQSLEQRNKSLEEGSRRVSEAAERAEANAARVVADVEARERTVAAREAAVAVVEEQVAANSIGEGTWTVGVDVQPGTYRTSSAVLGQCYWGIYRSGTNGSDIIDNNIVTGGFPTVQLREGQDFTNRDCGTFVKQ
ncbi:hypothetical protein [Geodermatophilus obscurus]|uniref:hypothetical protein n=1 Tax=Geodermatophilus obscurus TaxID=1861 RepID=UPI000943E7A8|nr:hypothetical protein [Geodermatophilus obscurus]